jgi:hypothetical protein
MYKYKCPHLQFIAVSDLLMAARDISNREETLACEDNPHIIRLRERGVKQGEGRISGRH